MPLIGKYLCFALLALSVDLIWGFCGILSLGHGAFFALGGYAMGMYLMRQIGPRGVYANPILPDFMVFLNWKELPWFWHGFDHFFFAALMVIVVPGALAFVFGWFAFRSRVTGVYLSIITQALTYALMLAFFRNDMGFGGNNGLTDFKDILGFHVHSDTTRAALFALSALALAAGSSLAARSSSRSSARCWSRSATPRAARASSATGSSTTSSASSSFSAVLAGVAGALYVPQVGIINPERIRAGQLDRGRDLGRGRRPRHAFRRGPRRGARQCGKTWFTGALPESGFSRSAACSSRHPAPAEGRRRHRASPGAASPEAGGRERRRAAPPRQRRGMSHGSRRWPRPCSISTTSASPSTASRR